MPQHVLAYCIAITVDTIGLSLVEPESFSLSSFTDLSATEAESTTVEFLYIHLVELLYSSSPQRQASSPKQEEKSSPLSSHRQQRTPSKFIPLLFVTEKAKRAKNQEHDSTCSGKGRMKHFGY